MIIIFPEVFPRRKIRARALYYTFFANYRKNREKAYKLYFSSEKYGFNGKGNRDAIFTGYC
ncbi:hypothetical protein HMPREF1552_00692 [Leptotrichia sp. oral taxon 879 str. F0557]|nr:hypothetical protein HMPREF1552_00692 [Leptotrichia sp. oral taxon 879 str. F0557]